MNAFPAPIVVYQIYIRATPEQVWHGLTDGDMTAKYIFGARVESSWQPGTPYRYVFPNGTVMAAGEVIASEPPHRLVTSIPQPEGAPIQAEFRIEANGPVCKLTLLHHGTSGAAGALEAWAPLFSGLKTLLETGEPLPTA